MIEQPQEILAIDPGPEESAWVLWSGRILGFAKQPNDHVLKMVAGSRADWLVLEQVTSYGMAVGREVFETVFWTGRFAQIFHGGSPDFVRVPRLSVKLHHCHDSKAKDSNIRQALVDRFGGKERAIGKKANPGPLYGIAGDCWSALAIALWYWDGIAFRQSERARQ